MYLILVSRKPIEYLSAYGTICLYTKHLDAIVLSTRSTYLAAQQEEDIELISACVAAALLTHRLSHPGAVTDGAHINGDYISIQSFIAYRPRFDLHTILSPCTRGSAATGFRPS